MSFLFNSKAREGFTGLEGFAVLGGEAIFINSGDVGFGAVADMIIETVIWVFGYEVSHVVITGDFGDDRGSGNSFEFCIGFDAGSDVWFERSI